MFARVTLLPVFLGILSLMAFSCSSDDDESPQTAETEQPTRDTPTTSSTETSVENRPQLQVSVQDVCDLAVRPTYLPWLVAGEAVLESGPVAVEGQTSLQWYEGPDPLSGASATLLVSLETPAPASEPLDLFLESVQTTFGTAPESGGVLVWDVNRQGCRGVALTLDNVPELSESEVREELTQIAEGLEPR